MSERDLTPSELWMRNLARRQDWPSRDVGPCPDDEILAARVEGGTLDVMHREALDSHLAGCDLCRQLVQDLILDGAGEHLPSVPTLTAADAGVSWWTSALAVLFPRRLITGFAPLALTFVAVTALGAYYAAPRIQRMIEEASAPPTPVKAVWTVTSKTEAPPASAAPAAVPPAALPVEAPAVEEVAPQPPIPAKRPVRKVRTLPKAAPTAAAPASEPAAVILPKLEPAPVVKPEPVVEGPKPPPIPERDAFTEMDRVFIAKYSDALRLVHDRQYGLALKHIEQMRPAASHKVIYTGMINDLYNQAQRGLDEQRGPCKKGYVWGVVRKEGNTTVERCILPDEAEKILDF